MKATQMRQQQPLVPLVVSQLLDNWTLNPLQPKPCAASCLWLWPTICTWNYLGDSGMLLPSADTSDTTVMITTKRLMRDQYLRTLGEHQLQLLSMQSQVQELPWGRVNKRANKPSYQRRQERRQLKREQEHQAKEQPQERETDSTHLGEATPY